VRACVRACVGTVINAAAALWVAGAAPDWKTAASQAAAAIASGAVEKTVASYVELTNK
jgi:anthranilate phosphoribosyltransferase